MFFINEKTEETTFNFSQNAVLYKMETQKIITLLNDSSNEEYRFATKKQYVIDNQTAKDNYNKNNSIRFETEIIKSSLCNYSDGYILVTGNITVVNAGNGTDVAFKNCAPFSTGKTDINEVFIDEANHIYIAIPMYNLNEYRYSRKLMAA